MNPFMLFCSVHSVAFVQDYIDKELSHLLGIYMVELVEEKHVRNS